ncbi:MAG: transcriptional regulator [Anaerolineae bacterium]
MQKTRQKILEYLRQHGEATVSELSRELDNLTAVTVRHHLDVLRSEGFVAAPEPVHRDAPGRPRYVYRLTDKAKSLFSQNVGTLASMLMAEMKTALPEEQLNVIFEGIARRMAAEMSPGAGDETLEGRLARVVAHLNSQGYEAHWEPHELGYVLHTANCPYGGVVSDHDDLCKIDMRYISGLLGTVPRRLGHLQEGEDTCSYLVVVPEPLRRSGQSTG